MSHSKKMKVLIAGIGGASLGTEILKSLSVTDEYEVFGCDISNLAYGHYMEGFVRTFVVDVGNYLDEIVGICAKERINVVIPGGEQPLQLLNKFRADLAANKIHLVANSSSLIQTFTDKFRTFEFLSRCGFEVPITIQPETEDDFDRVPYPCVIKPSVNSGGSDGVIISPSRSEALLSWRQAKHDGRSLILQELLPHDQGEFSLGVLSLPGVGVVGSIALRKTFENKFSIHAKSSMGIISGPYSSGIVQEYCKLREYAESIAVASQSEGPLNIQGRFRGDKFIPFEINPRFSGSEFIRTMAGFNQVHMYLTFLRTGAVMQVGPYREGYYLRSLSEMYVPMGKVKK